MICMKWSLWDIAEAGTGVQETPARDIKDDFIDLLFQQMVIDYHWFMEAVWTPI